MTAGRKSTKNNIDWRTPKKYVDAVLDVFGEIDLDPCSNSDSIVPSWDKFIYPEKDALSEVWNWSRVYCNPPYGKGYNGTTIYDWLKKCSNNEASDVIALIPVVPNTKHWKEFVFKSNAICFLSDTRLKFRINGSEDNKGASMACAMIYWGEYGKYTNKFIDVFRKYGNIVLNYDKNDIL